VPVDAEASVAGVSGGLRATFVLAGDFFGIARERDAPTVGSSFGASTLGGSAGASPVGRAGGTGDLLVVTVRGVYERIVGTYTMAPTIRTRIAHAKSWPGFVFGFMEVMTNGEIIAMARIQSIPHRAVG